MIIKSEIKLFHMFFVAITLWALLPATTKSTLKAPFIEIGYGYAPVADFYEHHAPPKVRGKIYQELVWRHERYSFLWLPFAGSKAGQYGLYRVERRGRSRRVLFVPLAYEQANQLAAKINVKLPRHSPVSYWSFLFGWLVILPLGYIFVKDREFYEKNGIGRVR